MNISELQKITGDVYVLGSGSSLDYVKPSFFKGKTVIGINHIHKLFPVTYGISNHSIGYEDIDFSDFDNPESLIVGATTSSAIHLAQRIGATTIILCGIDNGMIDGKIGVKKYPATNPQHIIDFEPQLKIVCNFIRSKGVGIYSLNPFINLNLEGHRFENCLLDS